MADYRRRGPGDNRDDERRMGTTVLRVVLGILIVGILIGAVITWLVLHFFF